MGNRKVVHQVTKQYMKKNFKRTLISYVGITLMVMLMTCVFVGKDTFLAYLSNMAEEHYGKWHISFYDIDREQLDNIEQKDYINETAVSENLFYTEFPQTGNSNRPYLNLRCYSEKTFDWMNINVTEGRLPENDNEIVISNTALKDGAKVAIGDEIQINCFRRYITHLRKGETVFPFLEFTVKDYETKEAPDNFPLLDGFEDLSEYVTETHEMTGFSKTYTVTGFIEAPSYEDELSAVYPAIAYVDESAIHSEKFNCTVRVNTKRLPSIIQEDFNGIIDEKSIVINNEVLSFYAASSQGVINEIIIAAQVFFTLLIISVSVILIYNVFNLSYDERCKYLGMLASIGATSKQKRSSVYYEAFSLLLSALPLGFAIGFGIVWSGVRVLSPLAAKLINSIIITEEVPVKLKITPFAVLLTVIFSVFTVLVSSMLPAHRISKIGAIESIRGNSEQNRVKIKKQSWLDKKFGFHLNAEGMLSMGFASNQKKKTRGIVRALSVFLIVLTVTAYGAQAVSQMILYKLGGSENIEISAINNRDYMVRQNIADSSPTKDIIDDLSQIKGISDLQVIYMGYFIGRTEYSTYSNEYWDKIYELVSLNYPGEMSPENFEKEYKEQTPSMISMVSVDSETFQEILKGVGGNTDTSLENPCIVFSTGELSTDSFKGSWGKKADYQFSQIDRMTDLKIGDTLPVYVTGVNDKDEFEDENINLTVAGFCTNENLDKWFTIHDEIMWVITEEKIALEVNEICSVLESGMFLSAFFNADESNPEVQSEFKLLENNNGESIMFTRTENISTAEMKELIREMIRILMIAFMIFSSLICFLNIYNSISGLMVSRRPDFAILRSVGMTKKQILKMCRYEMYLIILRSLAVAVPTAFILCYVFKIFIMGLFGTFELDFPIFVILFVAFAAVASSLGITAACCLRENKSDLMNEIKKGSI